MQVLFWGVILLIIENLLRRLKLAAEIRVQDRKLKMVKGFLE